MAGVDPDIGYETELGLLRYLIAFGDTTIQTYESKVKKSSEDNELLERHKYSIYGRFNEAVLKLQEKVGSDVIEIEWDQIQEIQAKSEQNSKLDDDLGQS